MPVENGSWLEIVGSRRLPNVTHSTSSGQALERSRDISGATQRSQRGLVRKPLRPLGFARGDGAGIEAWLTGLATE